MKALLSRTAGGPETLSVETVPDPVPAAGELLIAVRACGVNFPDVLVIQDLYQFRPDRPFSPGAELSGVVEMVGAGAEGFAVGDEVIALVPAGGMAEKAVVDARRCLAKPPAMPFDEAAGFVFTYATSHHALKDRARLKAGETLLVLGAAGGVGIAAVQLGRATGARVVVAVSTQEKLDFAKAHGADDGVLYPAGSLDKDGKKALSAALKTLCGGEGADVIYDAVGGDYAEPALRAIAPEGRYLVVGFPAGIPSIPLNLALLKQAEIIGVFWGDFVRRDPEMQRANLADLVTLYERGKIRPHIGERFPLEDGAKAIARLQERGALGKIVVTID